MIPPNAAHAESFILESTIATLEYTTANREAGIPLKVLMNDIVLHTAATLGQKIPATHQIRLVESVTGDHGSTVIRVHATARPLAREAAERYLANLPAGSQAVELEPDRVGIILPAGSRRSATNQPQNPRPDAEKA